MGLLIFTLVASVAMMLPLTARGAHQGTQLLSDPSFESLPLGQLENGRSPDAWEVQRKGRKSIQDRLGLACVEDQANARSGKKFLTLSLPIDTEGFEFVTVGQRLKLAPGKIYGASVWVRWTDGPVKPATAASPGPARPSAIVSFWARHRNGKGAFAGRDVWLFDNQWHKLAFSFCATDPAESILIYASLLPNQKPCDTTVLVDDFELMASDASPEEETRSGNLVQDSSFSAQQNGGFRAPWSFANQGGRSIAAAVAGKEGQQWIELRMPEGTSNFESAQLSQHLALQRGVRYAFRCRIRWDNFTPEKPSPIVNYGIYQEDSRTWYGPVDQVLEKNGEWNTYDFLHIPPASGRWKLYVQLNGWGNFARQVDVSVDDFTCTPES